MQYIKLELQYLKDRLKICEDYIKSLKELSEKYGKSIDITEQLIFANGQKYEIEKMIEHFKFTLQLIGD